MPVSHFVPASPSPSPCPQVHSLHLRLYSCPAPRFFLKQMKRQLRGNLWDSHCPRKPLTSRWGPRASTSLNSLKLPFLLLSWGQIWLLASKGSFFSPFSMINKKEGVWKSTIFCPKYQEWWKERRQICRQEKRNSSHLLFRLLNVSRLSVWHSLKEAYLGQKSRFRGRTRPRGLNCKHKVEPRFIF